MCNKQLTDLDNKSFSVSLKIAWRSSDLGSFCCFLFKCYTLNVNKSWVHWFSFTKQQSWWISACCFCWLISHRSLMLLTWLACLRQPRNHPMILFSLVGREWNAIFRDYDENWLKGSSGDVFKYLIWWIIVYMFFWILTMLYVIFNPSLFLWSDVRLIDLMIEDNNGRIPINQARIFTSFVLEVWVGDLLYLRTTLMTPFRTLEEENREVYAKRLERHLSLPSTHSKIVRESRDNISLIL